MRTCLLLTRSITGFTENESKILIKGTTIFYNWVDLNSVGTYDTWEVQRSAPFSTILGKSQKIRHTRCSKVFLNKYCCVGMKAFKAISKNEKVKIIGYTNIMLSVYVHSHFWESRREPLKYPSEEVNTLSAKYLQSWGDRRMPAHQCQRYFISASGEVSAHGCLPLPPGLQILCFEWNLWMLCIRRDPENR